MSKSSGCLEHAVVVAGRAGEEHDPGVGRDGDPVQLDVALHPTALVVRRAVPAQALLDRVRATSDGSAASSARWSGYHARATTMLPISLAVVSCPATTSSTTRLATCSRVRLPGRAVVVDDLGLQQQRDDVVARRLRPLVHDVGHLHRQLERSVDHVVGEHRADHRSPASPACATSDRGSVHARRPGYRASRRSLRWEGPARTPR